MFLIQYSVIKLLHIAVLDIFLFYFYKLIPNTVHGAKRVCVSTCVGCPWKYVVVLWIYVLQTLFAQIFRIWVVFSVCGFFFSKCVGVFLFAGSCRLCRLCSPAPQNGFLCADGPTDYGMRRDLEECDYKRLRCKWTWSFSGKFNCYRYG